MFDRYFQTRERGNQRVAALIELKPFSCLLGGLLLMSVVGASIYLGVFTDSREELWRHLWQSLSVIFVLAFIFGVFFRRESLSPLPLRMRRWLWQSIVIGYLVLALLLFASLLLPGRAQAERTILSLGASSPLAFTAWQLLKKTKKTNQTST